MDFLNRKEQRCFTDTSIDISKPFHKCFSEAGFKHFWETFFQSSFIGVPAEVLHNNYSWCILIYTCLDIFSINGELSFN